jgi:hypothetical protein
VDAVADFALQNKAIILKIHLTAVIFALGSVLAADIFFARLVIKLSASAKEINILTTFSKFIWLGLAIIVPAGILLIASDTQTYFNLPRIMVKMIVIFATLTNGIFLNILVTPRLISIPFKKLMLSTDKNIRNARRLMFALGSISTISWWFAFVLGFVKTISFSFQTILTIYLFFIISGILMSQVIEYVNCRRKINS